MIYYRERLLPGPGVFLATALVIPASLLVFLPISTTAGVTVAIVLFLACVAMLVITSPVLEVSDDGLAAGRARVPLRFIGAAEGFERQEATAERGLRLDARAWLVIRGWIDPVVKIELTDDDDPAPYWLVSTRKPLALVEAIGRAKSGTATPTASID